jgi:hypothetical protein
MPELFFFGTVEDFASIGGMANEVERYYVISRKYSKGERLDIYENLTLPPSQRNPFFYIVPKRKLMEDLLLSESPDGSKLFIADKVGSAALALNLYSVESDKINVASLSVHNKTYDKASEKLVKTEQSILNIYKRLDQEVRKSGRRLLNDGTPKYVYILPTAAKMALEYSWPLPWKTATFFPS